MMPMYKRYKKSKPAGTMAFCNTFGIAIWDPDDEDRNKDNCDLIAAWWSADSNYLGFHRHKIYYTQGARPYIRKGEMRIYLDEVTRTA